MKRLRRVVIGLMGLGLAQTAQAQISADSLTAFNQAVETGDAAAIEMASTNLMNDAIANSDDPDALIAAYEAALKLCDIDCEAALPGAEFALGFPATGQHPIMAERELLFAFADFSRRATGSTRTRLEAALANMQDPTRLSARAFLPLYSDYAGNFRMSEAARVSGMAVEHLRSVRSSVPQYYLHALESYATTGFIDVKSRETHETLVRWNAEMKQMRSQVHPDERPDWLESVYWRSEAWVGTANVYYQSLTTQSGSRGFDMARTSSLSPSEVRLIGLEYPVNMIHFRTRQQMGEEFLLPHCEGDLVMDGELDWPSRARNNGTVGYVIVGFDLDNEGRARNPEVLASVPPGVYDDTSLDRIRDWYWEVDEGVDRSSCRMSAYDLNSHHSFQFER